MKLPEHIKGAIFDLDGTLLDSIWIWAEIDRRFLSKRGFDVPPDYMAAVGAMEYLAAAEYTVKRFGLSDTPEALTEEWSEMAVAAYENELRLKPNVKTALAELKNRGLKLAVATGALPEMCLPALKANGIDGIFDAVVTTKEIGKGKAEPDVYLAAAKRLDLAPKHIAVFEDTVSAVTTAKSAGFYVVGVADSYSAGDEQAIKRISDDFITFG